MQTVQPLLSISRNMVVDLNLGGGENIFGHSFGQTLKSKAGPQSAEFPPLVADGPFMLTDVFWIRRLQKS